VNRVLVVSYFYPPFSSVGATRVSKMTRYLRDAGWTPHVLTVDQCDYPRTLPVEIPDESITRAPQMFDLASIPRTLVGRRRLATDRVAPRQSKYWAMLWTIGLAYRHLICFPDGQIGWKRSAIARGVQLVREFKPDIILSSSLPNTSHLVARAIAQQAGVPWVAELRDLWTENHNFRRVQPLRAFEARLERSVLMDADALVTVSEVWAERLRAQFGRPTFVVPNGFDPNDYPRDPRPDTGMFRLVYTGMFYDGRQNPDPLFHAVRQLADSGRIDPRWFRLQFVGQYLGPIRLRAEAFGISPFVEVGSPVPYLESLKLQSAATALLFLDWNNDKTEGWYSAKIYEYLGAGRPILSIGPTHTVVARLLARTGAGEAASSTEQVVSLLQRWLAQFERGATIPYAADEAIRRRFQRQEAAVVMASVFDYVLSRAPRRQPVKTA
jgi:glycosyltransferase involved in cell wall biosynthesis